MNISLKYYNGPVDFEVNIGIYAPHHPILIGRQPLTGEPLFKASVNLPDFRIPEYCIIVKSYSEGEGMASELQRLDMIGPELFQFSTGITGLTVHQMSTQLAEQVAQLKQERKTNAHY